MVSKTYSEREHPFYKLEKIGFQIKGSDPIQLIMEDRLRYTCGPVQFHASVTFIVPKAVVENHWLGGTIFDLE